MTGTRVARALLGCVLLGLMAGCGETDSGGVADDGLRAPVAMVDGEVLVSCFGSPPGWPASAMVDGIEPPVPTEEIEAALDAVATEPGLSVETSRVLPQGGRTPWKVLAGDTDRLTIALGDWRRDGPARSAMTMDLGRDEQGGWAWQGHGSCALLAPVLSTDGTWVEVTADSVPTDTTEVAVQVTERDCASSRDPAPFLDEPVLIETPTDVTVYWTSRPPEGDQSCPGNPSMPQTLTLDEPLGDRQLLDGSRWPPVPIG